jgi:hypothetical protein
LGGFRSPNGIRKPSPKPKLVAYDEALRAQVAQKADITLVGCKLGSPTIVR